MGEDIGWLVVTWLLAIIFYGIGIYASKRKKPMFFWSGSIVDPKTITDIPEYNKSNSKMWKIYSIPYWIIGISYIWFPIFQQS